MKDKAYIIIPLVVALCLVVGILIISSNNDNKKVLLDEGTVQNLVDESENKNKANQGNKYQSPDLSKAQVPKASTEAVDCTDEEKFVSALEAFANPNGNEYDALSILGAFRYNEQGDDLLKRLATASKSWHEPIQENVGEKCIVDISVKDIKPYDMTDEVVTEWNTANGKTCKGYSRITCVISNNYSTDTLTYSFDIVNVDGNWYLAQTSILNKLQSILTSEIYK